MMEKRILKWTTWSLGILTVLMCTGLYCMPSFKEKFVASSETDPQVLQQDHLIDLEQDEIQDAKLNIELPEGISERDVEIINDYVNHTLYVRFAEGVDDYSQDYVVEGSERYVEFISYYMEGESGVLEIKLDKVWEHSYTYEDGFLCIELKDLRDTYEKIVVIDAGHGGKMPGAVRNNIYEKELNLAIVLKLKELLDEVEDENLKVLYTRTEDFNPSFEERVALANDVNADLFISVHNNSSGTKKFDDENGTVVMYSSSKTNPESKTLAQICLENVTHNTGSKKKTLLKADDIYIIRNSKVPVALIEVGYMTNKKELNNLCDDKYQEKAAKGIYNAIMQVLEEGF